MPLDYDTLLNWPFEEVEHSYSKRDTMLYALGLGFGSDPNDQGQLTYVYEKSLKSFPTMAVVLGHPGNWMTNPKAGINMVKVLHGEQHLTIHKDLPIEGTIVGQTKVLDVIDKGSDRGALISIQRTIYEKSTGDLLNTQIAVIFARGNGGFGGPSGKSLPRPQEIPERAPDCHEDLFIGSHAALLYRLNGDYNPLHSDPEIARSAGFDQPILHGLATYGVAARALMLSLRDGTSTRFTSFNARFSAPVFPGETLRTEMWHEPDVIIFRASVLDRGVTVLNNGSACTM